MGNSFTFSQPYIVDEYYSDDDELNYDSGTESSEDASPPRPVPASEVDPISENHNPQRDPNDFETRDGKVESKSGQPSVDVIVDTPSTQVQRAELPDPIPVDEAITATNHKNLSSALNTSDTKELPWSATNYSSKKSPTSPINDLTAAAAENGCHDDQDEDDLEAEQRRTLERLDSDLSTFEAVEQSLLEASKEFSEAIGQNGQEDSGLASLSRVSPPGSSSSSSGSHTASAIPRLQRSASGRSQQGKGHDLEPSREQGWPIEEQAIASHASPPLRSSAPVSGVEDNSPPSPSTHQLVHSFSMEEADASGTPSPTGNPNRGISPRRHSGIPVRQNSFSGGSSPNAAAYILYKGSSEADGLDRPDGGPYQVRGVPASSDRDTDADDVSFSDLTGRVRGSKKRSGIPSAWMAKSKGDVSPRSTRSGSPRGSEMDTSRSPMDRKVLDIRRWYCMSRPQYRTSCGISSLVSCWNFLFSSLGHGNLKPLTQETALSILGFSEPFDEIGFGPSTGNLAIMRWFQLFNANFRVKGKCYFLFKPVGKNSTPGVTPEMALNFLKQGLRDPSMAFIYHCENHYFCPIGFEESARVPKEAYKTVPEDKRDAWILIGEISKHFPSVQCKNWKDICTDLNTKSPEYFDIRRQWLGVRQRNTNRPEGGNVHCIMAFQKCPSDDEDWESLVSTISRSESENLQTNDPSLSTTDGEVSELERQKKAAEAKRLELVTDATEDVVVEKDGTNKPEPLSPIGNEESEQREKSLDEEEKDKSVESETESSSLLEPETSLGEDSHNNSGERSPSRRKTSRRKSTRAEELDEDAERRGESPSCLTSTWEVELEREDTMMRTVKKVERLLATIVGDPDETSQSCGLDVAWQQQQQQLEGLDDSLADDSISWVVHLERGHHCPRPTEHFDSAQEENDFKDDEDSELDDEDTVCDFGDREREDAQTVSFGKSRRCKCSGKEKVCKKLMVCEDSKQNDSIKVKVVACGHKNAKGKHIRSAKIIKGKEKKTLTKRSDNKSNSKSKSPEARDCCSHQAEKAGVETKRCLKSNSAPDPSKIKGIPHALEKRAKLRKSLYGNDAPHESKSTRDARSVRGVKKVMKTGSFYKRSPVKRKSKPSMSIPLDGVKVTHLRKPVSVKEFVESKTVVAAFRSGSKPRSLKPMRRQALSDVASYRLKKGSWCQIDGDMLLDIKRRAESWDEYESKRMKEKAKGSDERPLKEDLVPQQEIEKETISMQRKTCLRRQSKDRGKSEEEMEREKSKRRKEWK